MNVFTITGRPMTLRTGYAEVLVVRDGYIVGKSPDDASNTPMGINVGPIQGDQSGSVPGWVTLLGCPRGITDPMRPHAGRATLPPGQYQLVGVVFDYPKFGSNDGRIISIPKPITVQ